MAHAASAKEVKLISPVLTDATSRCALNEISQALSNLALLSLSIGSGGRI